MLHLGVNLRKKNKNVELLFRNFSQTTMLHFMVFFTKLKTPKCRIVVSEFFPNNHATFYVFFLTKLKTPKCRIVVSEFFPNNHATFWGLNLNLKKKKTKNVGLLFRFYISRTTILHLVFSFWISFKNLKM